MTETEKQQREKFIQMTETPIKPLVCRMAVPTMISMLITAFYNMADTFFVGKINKSATAAVGVIFSLMAIIQAVGFFFGHGSGNYISRRLGEREQKKAEEMAAVGFFSAFAGGAVIMVLGLAFLKPFARFLGSTDTILPYAVDYMRIILVGAPFMTSSLVLNNQLRLQGNAFFAMIGITTGAVLNVVLDPLLIFVFDMGISGAALATVISQIISFVILYIGMLKGSTVIIRFKNFKPTKEKYLAVIQGGSPSLFRQGLASIATILLNRATGVYGDAAVAAISIVQRVSFFAYSALLGFGQGFQPVCGFNYGAKLYERIKKAYWFCIKISTTVFSTIMVFAIIFAPQIIAVFCDNDAQVLEIGINALRLQSMSYPFLSFMVVTNMLLQNINRYKQATLLAIGRQGLFFLPLIIILPHVFGLTGIEYCQPLADILSFVLAIPMSIMVLRELK